MVKFEGIKSFKLLCEFGKFCFDHPELRFWQALRAWSGYDKILAAEVHTVSGYIEHQRDTYYFESKRHDG